MKEAIFSFESIILFLSVGVVLGLIFLLIKVLKIVLGIKKIGEAVLDIILCLLSAVVVFLCALALDGGKLRFFQVFLHIIGALSVIWILDPMVQGIARVTSKAGRKLKRFLKAKLEKISQKKKKKSKKHKKKPLQKTIKVQKKKIPEKNSQ